MSKFLIYNASREKIGMLQNESSVQWLEAYGSNGEIKIEARATPGNIALLIEGNRIYNPDSDTVARISHVDTTDAKRQRTITARGDLTSELLGDRVIMGTESVTNIEAGMYSIYSKNRRNLPITAGTPTGYPEKTDIEISWGSVLDAEKKLSEISGLGFKVVFDPVFGTETFKVYKGKDRSKETSPDYVGYFGLDAGNMSNVFVSSGSTGFKNVAIVAGAGEGASRTIRTVSLGNVSGENRRELYVDARDLQREYQIATATGEYDNNGNPIYSYETKTYTNAEYNAILDARGLEKLAEHLRYFSITCDIEQRNILYGVDYFLGDRMPVKVPWLGLSTSARIASANMIYEKQGRRIVCILSEFEIAP